MSHTLALITVVYQNYKVLQDFLDSCRAQTDTNYHLFIADHSPKPQPIKAHGLPVTVIPSENLGYAHGINIAQEAAHKAGYSKYCIINDDTYFEKDLVSRVKASLHTSPSSIITGKIYYAAGYEYHPERYTKKDQGNVLWYAGGTTDWAHVSTHHRGVDEVDNGQYDVKELTQFISGCFMCYDHAVVESVGRWDARYFLYFEDADFSERALRRGIPLWYDPSLKIWHKSGQSTEGAASALQQKYMKENRMRFGMKYAPLRTKLHLLKHYLTGSSF